MFTRISLGAGANARIVGTITCKSKQGMDKSPPRGQEWNMPGPEVSGDTVTGCVNLSLQSKKIKCP